MILFSFSPQIAANNQMETGQDGLAHQFRLQ